MINLFMQKNTKKDTKKTKKNKKKEKTQKTVFRDSLGSSHTENQKNLEKTKKNKKNKKKQYFETLWEGPPHPKDLWKIVFFVFFGFLEVFLVFLHGGLPKTSGTLFFFLFFRGFGYCPNVCKIFSCFC